MKKIIFGIICMALPMAGWCNVGDVLDVKISNSVYSGFHVEVKILSETSKTCQLGDGTNSAVYVANEYVTGGKQRLTDFIDNFTFDIPEKVSGYKVVAIGDKAFYNGTKLTGITIPLAVTTIGNYAFSGCNQLTNITLPSALQTIGNSAFMSCPGFTEITIPSAVTTLGDNAFDRCTNLATITFSGNSHLQSIGQYAFQQCPFTTIALPQSTQVIGDFAFSKCKQLASLNIPKNVQAVSGLAFNECSAMRTLTVDADNTYFNDGDGQNCIVNTNTNQLVRGCPGTVIPSTVTSIGNNAFGDYGMALTEIAIPDGVTQIDNNAFYGATGLTSITLPANLKSIGYQAFYNCKGLTSITFPTGLTSIGDFGFASCSNIKSITFLGDAPTLGSMCFATNTGAKLYIDDQYYDNFIAKYWNTNQYATGGIFAHVDVEIGTLGIRTFSYGKDLDFTDVEGLTAYYVSAYDDANGTLTMTKADGLMPYYNSSTKPGVNGVILKGAPGVYKVPVVQEKTQAAFTNYLMGWVSNQYPFSYTSDKYYVLANGANGVGFYHLSTSGYLGANKAVLYLYDRSASTTRPFSMDFDSEASAIALPSTASTTSTFYNMQGQPTDNPTRGLYIVNGRKVLVK